MRIGVIGAGQLGRMLALAGYPLGLQFTFLDRGPDTPAAPLGELVAGPFDSIERLSELAGQCDVLTFEFENVPAPSLHALPVNVPLYPPADALLVAQDRALEKRLFEELDIPSGPSRPVGSLDELQAAARELGLPAILKTRRLGYDGKGQQRLCEPADLPAAWQGLGAQPLLLEQFVPFDFEVSLIGVRASTGETAFYPLTRNRHAEGILRESLAPYADAALQSQAERAMQRIFDRFNYVGVLTIEFFVKDGQLLANEIAPRVHNSGHWTIEGAVTSQFENHLRAISGLPLGSTAVTGHSVMVNFIGAMPATADALAIEGLHLHDYAKAPRPGRKLGHATLVCGTARARDAGVTQLQMLAAV